MHRLHQRRVRNGLALPRLARRVAGEDGTVPVHFGDGRRSRHLHLEVRQEAAAPVRIKRRKHDRLDLTPAVYGRKADNGPGVPLREADLPLTK